MSSLLGNKKYQQKIPDSRCFRFLLHNKPSPINPPIPTALQYLHGHSKTTRSSKAHSITNFLSGSILTTNPSILLPFLIWHPNHDLLHAPSPASYISLKIPMRGKGIYVSINPIAKYRISFSVSSSASMRSDRCVVNCSGNYYILSKQQTSRRCLLCLSCAPLVVNLLDLEDLEDLSASIV